MTRGLKVVQGSDGVWDIPIEGADLASEESFDSILAYALLGERRASASEVSIPQNRRGWIGNEGSGFENGSKLWIFKQAKLTRSVLNDIETTSLDALSFLVPDKAINVTTRAFVRNSFVMLEVVIFVTESQVETRFFQLWKNTGR